MLRSICWYAHFLGSLVMTTTKLGHYRKLQKTLPKQEFEQAVDDFVSAWADSQIQLSGATFQLVGEENIPQKGACLFVANHQSNFDIAFFMAKIKKPKGYISKTEVLKIPFLRQWMVFMGCVFMDRSDLKKSAKAILDGISILKNGHSLVIFPEGTRSKGGPVAEFKAGSFKLATKAKVPIVPVTICNTYKIMEANKNRIKPAFVTFVVHQPIETNNLSPEEMALLPERVRQIIISGLR